MNNDNAIKNSGENSNNAPAYDVPTGRHDGVHFKAYYGNQLVPHPTNAKAKIVPQAEVMRATREAK